MLEFDYMLIKVRAGKGKVVYTKVSPHRFQYLNKFIWELRGGTKNKQRVYRKATECEILTG